MRYSLSLSSLAAAAAARSPLALASEPPITFTPILTATLHLGQASTAIAIAIPGGVVINEPIVSGTVNGSAINATITGGSAQPPIYNNGTLQVPTIDVYGSTHDGESFYNHEEGVGMNAAQVTRIELSIGGPKYKYLSDGFILASVNANKLRTMVSVEGFLVENILK